MIRFYLGLDLGQVSDYTALAIVEDIRGAAPPVLHLRHLERLTLGTSYPDMARHVKALLTTTELAGKTVCVVDATGVGRPVVDMLREAEVQPLTAVTITGGDVASHDGGDWRVPKRDLVSTLQVLLQNETLKIAKGLVLAEVLVREMQNFRVKINIATGHDSYEAWRESEHDDLVLAVAMACWYARAFVEPVWMY